MTAVRRVPGGVRDPGGAATHRATFDAVVVATHSDQALALLAEPTAAERAGARRHAVLDQPRAAAHRRIGPAATPPGPRVVELSDDRRDDDEVVVTYDITRLMRLSAAEALPGHPGRPVTASTPAPCSPR